MNKFDLHIKPLGNQAILIEWPNKIQDAILDDIIHFTNSILNLEKGYLTNYTPGYNSLLLQYKSTINFDQKKQMLTKLYPTQEVMDIFIPKCWNIPVCYDEKFGLDLPLFENHGLTQKEVIQLHTSATYRVYMIGFLPGFLYLGGLPQNLHMHRKDTPRMNIPKGSVAIGGEQTGIYPMTSPGGWQIIGRTPLTLFNLNSDEPIQIRQGDKIQFYAIDMITYQNLSSN